jgi:membrane associated rhomboid family serine protease
MTDSTSDPFASPPPNRSRQSLRSSYRKSIPNLNAPLPALPQEELAFEPSQLNPHITASSTYTSPFDDPTYQIRRSPTLDFEDDEDDINDRRHSRHVGIDQDPFTDDDAIPLRQQYSQREDEGEDEDEYSVHERHYYGYNHDRNLNLDPSYDTPRNAPLPPPPPPPTQLHRPSRSRSPRRLKAPFFSFATPWVTYALTTIQLLVFLVELIKAGLLTGSPIEIKPSFNPMIGPSPYILINMGARYVPCMRLQSGIQDANATISWPCPNATTSTASCSLSQLCGFGGIPSPVIDGSLEDPAKMPNQWFRFVTPIFLHAGIVHIGFNMLLQILLGGDVERLIGHVRFFILYFASGIFGFIAGGNFAPAGISSTGASGALFGLIAVTLLDLVYDWRQRRTPMKDLLFIVLDIAVSFVLGLLPGVDNFSHIGGFVMGILLAVFLLRSPDVVKKTRVKLGEHGHARTETADSMEEALRMNGGMNGLAPGAGLGGKDVTATARPLSVRKEPTTKHSPLPPLPLPGHLQRPASTVFDSPSVPPAPTTTATKKLALPRTKLHVFFWAIRLLSLVLALVFFVVLVRKFYASHQTECRWCRYLSCLPVNGWCEIGDLVFVSQ